MMYGDINGYNSGKRGGRRIVGSADFYRHVPKEMTESTKLGVFMSILSLTMMIILFLRETYAFLHTQFHSSVVIDYYHNDESKTKSYNNYHNDHVVDEEMHHMKNRIRLNFNVTLYDVQCDFASVDVWDTLGTNRHNVTKDITKYTIDNSGQTRNFHGRNREEQAILHDNHHKEGTGVVVGRPQYRYIAGKIVKVLQQEDGRSFSSNTSSPSSTTKSTTTTATDLTPDNIQDFFNTHSLLVIDYYAPWCLWCQRLSPVWDKFANEIQQHQQQNHHGRMNVGVGKVDCVEHVQYCKEERIMAFPTIRWYQKGGKAIVPDYRGDRTVEAFMKYAKRQTGTPDADEDDAEEEKVGDEENHPGCQLSGHLMVNRVPGTLIIEAKSINHDIHSAMMNMTHRIHHLSFGPPLLSDDNQRWRFFGNWRSSRSGSNIPGSYKHATDPMKEKYYPTYKPHEAYHHSLKIVSTHVKPDNRNRFFSIHEDDIMIYQILEESQLILYNEQSSPEIKFVWDLSPMGVKVSREGIPWYEYLTNLLAIIGGTYTTLGLINAILLKIFKPKRI